MTTKRNNASYDHGFIDGINLALQSIEKYGDLEKVKECLLKFKEAKTKHMTDCSPEFTRTSIETDSIITNYYFVTVKDGEYIIVDKKVGDKVNEVIYWSEDISTQYIITLCGDFDEVADKIDNDDEFLDNLGNLIGIASGWIIIDRPMVIDITHDWRYDHYRLDGMVPFNKPKGDLK